MADIYFTDYFGVSKKALRSYGALNISLVTDLPLFIDPFLLFNSTNQIYRQLHEDIITYVRFLRDRSAASKVDRGTMREWFVFSEVRQTWLGYSDGTNHGSGLGFGFAQALNANLNDIFRDFGNERVTQGSHLEKLCLVGSGVGRDHVSDFTTNLIKEFLLDYSQTFAKKYLMAGQRRRLAVPRVRFNYQTQTWQTMEFELPWFNGDYVLLTPRNLLTKDDTWINRSDLIAEFQTVVAAVPNDQLRAQINNYFIDRLGKKSTQKERSEAALATVRKFPAFIEYYIRYKEDHGDQARTASESRVKYSELVFVERGQSLSTALKTTGFYGQNGYTYAEAHDRIAFLKKVIEDQDGWRLFYIDGKPVRREKDLQVLFRLTWRGTPSDVNREVNNGRGPVDFSISRGSGDKTLVEFKLASNSQLAQNLKHQLEVYQRAGQAQHVIKVVLYFTEGEFARVRELLKSLGLSKHKDIMLIDGREKISASKATDATEKR